ncbi:hypothetical protein [Crenobacter cavernae]|uniref:Polyphosphate kinase-2-related domain-containing protein n=1 Tax=Crenobacter cavernae TaxID=2290923 RepID=A0A345Y5W1_9NEIS|nr:hypothetical protein [Crenobacter cavernae]AXK39313.1 hypothetical protein DWG20_07650 [Crenobacter cavernae]
MFESAEIGHAIAKETFLREAPKLREALLDAQYELKERGDFPLLILIHGFDGAGRGETMNLVNEWLDPRLIRTVAFDAPDDEEKAQPWLWHFWRHVPGRGGITLFDRSGYGRVLVERVEGCTGTDKAPWHLIEANNKYHARIKVLEILCRALAARLGG